MNDFFEKMAYYLSFDFVKYAFIVGILISLCAALVGVTLVSKRYSYISDGLSHVAFGAMSIATVLNLTDNMYIILPVTIISAVLILGIGQNSKIKGDAIIALASVSSLALGYVILNVSKTSANIAGDVCSSLFGSTSILTLSLNDVIFCAILSAIIIISYTVLYNRIFLVTFDENYAKASGVHTKIYNLIIAIIIALIIVVAMNLVGSLLISALVIFPALSGMRICKTYKSVTIFSVIFGVVCSIIGIIISIILSTPLGSTVVLVDLCGFIICFILGLIKK